MPNRRIILVPETEQQAERPPAAHEEELRASDKERKGIRSSAGLTTRGRAGHELRRLFASTFKHSAGGWNACIARMQNIDTVGLNWDQLLTTSKTPL